MASVVLRIPLGEKLADQDHILVNVTPSGKGGLDLILEGTESTSPYVGSVSQSSISKLLFKNSSLDVKDWENMLLFVLLRRENGPKESLENLETIASVSSNRDRIVLTIRKSISGVHQRLGEISLEKDESHELDILSWVSTAVARTASVEQTLLALQAKHDERGRAMENLSSQLEELVKARDSDEKTLLARFCESLNFKKLKVRDQQRLLATAKVDRSRAAEVSANRNVSMGKRQPAPSRTNKRKDSRASSESESGFENIEASQLKEDISDAAQTTASEDDLDDLDSGSTSQSGTIGKSAKGKSTAVPIRRKDNGKVMGKGSPPPTRVLPFGKIGGVPVTTMKGKDRVGSMQQQPSSPPAIAMNDGDDGGEETTSDDEL